MASSNCKASARSAQMLGPFLFCSNWMFRFCEGLAVRYMHGLENTELFWFGEGGRDRGLVFGMNGHVG